MNTQCTCIDDSTDDKIIEILCALRRGRLDYTLGKGGVGSSILLGGTIFNINSNNLLISSLY